MRYSEIVESHYEGHKQTFLRQIARPDDSTGYVYDNANRPRLTFRMLHKLRIKKDRDKREREEHLVFLPTMYSDPVEEDADKSKSAEKVEKQADKAVKKIIKGKDRQEEKVGADAFRSTKER